MTPDQRLAVARDGILRARVWLIPSAVWWVLLGAGTIQGFAGRPEDAPHLHVPEVLRGWVWIGTGLLALVILLSDHKGDERRTRLAAALLLVMPIVRAVSYSWAWWVYAIGQDGGHFARWYQEGSSSAWYSCVPWWVISWAILSQAVNWPRTFRAALKCVRCKLRKGGDE